MFRPPSPITSNEKYNNKFHIVKLKFRTFALFICTYMKVSRAARSCLCRTHSDNTFSLQICNQSLHRESDTIIYKATEKFRLVLRDNKIEKNHNYEF